MDIGLLLKVGGVGLIVGVICQILNKAGRDDQGMLVAIAGVVIVLLLVVQELSELIETIRQIFGI